VSKLYKTKIANTDLDLYLVMANISHFTPILGTDFTTVVMTSGQAVSIAAPAALLAQSIDRG
jgi:hypothetical protein